MYFLLGDFQASGAEFFFRGVCESCITVEGAILKPSWISFSWFREAELCKKLLTSVKGVVFWERSQSELCGEAVSSKSMGTVIIRSWSLKSVAARAVSKVFPADSEWEKFNFLLTSRIGVICLGFSFCRWWQFAQMKFCSENEIVSS